MTKNDINLTRFLQFLKVVVGFISAQNLHARKCHAGNDLPRSLLGGSLHMVVPESGQPREILTHRTLGNPWPSLAANKFLKASFGQAPRADFLVFPRVRVMVLMV